MEISGESTAAWGCPASEADCEGWSVSNTEAGNPWEGVEQSSSKIYENPWEYKSAKDTPKRTMEQNQTSTDLRADFNSRAPEIGRPVPESEEVEVPDSAVPHIIGQARRTINALKNIPGITQVTTYLIQSTDQNHKNPMQRVKVEGSSSAAVSKVITQIKRIVLRSAAKSMNPEVSVICLPQKNKDEDAISLKLATAEEYQQYLSTHLKPFVIQHAPPDVLEKKYFSFARRVCSDQLTGNAQFVTKKRRRSYAGDCHLFGSWDSNLYTAPISTNLRKFFEDSELSCRGKPPQMKIRIQLGQMFHFGTDLTPPETWNVSVAELETMTLEQALRPCFSSYCRQDIVEKARKFLQASRYEQHKPESSQDTVCAELVDMDSPTKPVFNIRFIPSDKIASKINLKSRRHAYVTFVDDMQGHDLQLRVQSRQQEPVLDENKRRAVYEAWTKRAGIEEPLSSPTGHNYFPLRVLRKSFEYYRKGEMEIVLIRVSPVMEPNSDNGLQDENNDINCRWKISLSFVPPGISIVDDGDLDHIVTRLTELVDEAKKFSEAISFETG